jgi:hypothetical protein
MKKIFLTIDNSVYNESEKVIAFLKKPRSRYINEAIDFYYKLHTRKFLGEKLKMESEMVRDDSIAVLKEFEDIDVTE